MNKVAFIRPSNIFDDESISDERLERYRKAQPLQSVSRNVFQKSFVKKQSGHFSAPSTITSSNLIHSNSPDIINKNLNHNFSEVEKQELLGLNQKEEQLMEYERSTSFENESDNREQIIRQILPSIIEENKVERSSSNVDKEHKVDKKQDYKIDIETRAGSLRDKNDKIDLTISSNIMSLKETNAKGHPLFAYTMNPIESDRMEPLQKRHHSLQDYTSLVNKNFEENKLMEDKSPISATGKQIQEEKIPETERKRISITKDDIDQLDEKMNDEQRKIEEEIKSLKLGFLVRLEKLKKDLDSIREEQTSTKQSDLNSLQETVNRLSELISSSLNVEERKTKYKENLINYHLQVTKTKQELTNLRSFVLYSIEKIKEKIANYLKEDGKNQLQKMIEESAKHKLVNRMNELFNSERSGLEDHSETTPTKEEVSETESSTKSKKEKRSSRKSKMDTTVIEGMLYLLDHEALKNPFKSKKEFRQKLEKILKTHQPEEITSEVVLNSLIDRSERKKMRDSKRSKLEESSVHENDESLSQDPTDIESVTSAKMELMTPTKKGKKSRMIFNEDENFLYNQVNKAFSSGKQQNQEKKD